MSFTNDPFSISAIYEMVACEKSKVHGWFICFYCGEPADTTDYCPPKHKLKQYKAMDIISPKYWIVKCCGECKSLLANTIQSGLIARAQEAKAKLRAKYSKRDIDAEWQDEEIDQLGRTLRGFVSEAASKKHDLFKRIDYHAAINLFLSENPDQY